MLASSRSVLTSLRSAASRLPAAPATCTDLSLMFLPSPPCARCVHSKRVLKRKQNHPAERARRAAAGLDQPPAEAPKLQYEGSYVPPYVSYNGWSPAPETPPENVPFFVRRTAKAKELPVYTKGRHPFTATLVRRVEGDIDEMARDVSVLCGKPAEVRLGNHVWVRGHHTGKIKEWLVGLGF